MKKKIIYYLSSMMISKKKIIYSINSEKEYIFKDIEINDSEFKNYFEEIFHNEEVGFEELSESLIKKYNINSKKKLKSILSNKDFQKDYQKGYNNSIYISLILEDKKDYKLINSLLDEHYNRDSIFEDFIDFDYMIENFDLYYDKVSSSYEFYFYDNLESIDIHFKKFIR